MASIEKFKPELINRIQYASKNGSVIATDILNKISTEDCIREEIGSINSFKVFSKDKSRLLVQITFEKSWIDNNNEEHSRKAREESDCLTRIVEGLPSYTTAQRSIFKELLNIDSDITIKVFTEKEDYIKVFDHRNRFYQARYETYGSDYFSSSIAIENAAEFYTKNVDTRLIVAYAENKVLGYAIVWNNAILIPNSCLRTNVIEPTSNEIIHASYLSYVITSYSTVYVAIWNKALELGVMTSKWTQQAAANGYYHQSIETKDRTLYNSGLKPMDDSTANEMLNNLNGVSEYTVNAEIKFPEPLTTIRIQPYDLEYIYVVKYGDHHKVLLSDDNLGLVISRMQPYPRDLANGACANCGKVESKDRDLVKNKLYYGLCRDCREKMIKKTPVGPVLSTETVEWNKCIVPKSFIERGKPTETFQIYLNLIGGLDENLL